MTTQDEAEELKGRLHAFRETLKVEVSEGSFEWDRPKVIKILGEAYESVSGYQVLCKVDEDRENELRYREIAVREKENKLRQKATEWDWIEEATRRFSAQLSKHIKG